MEELLELVKKMRYAQRLLNSPTGYFLENKRIAKLYEEKVDKKIKEIEDEEAKKLQKTLF